MTSELQTIPNVGPAVARKLERLDIAAVDYANGGPPRPWWEYSRERKARAGAAHG